MGTFWDLRDRAIDIIFVRNGCCQFFKNADCTEWVETVTDMVHPPKITTLAPQVTRNQIRSFRCTEEKQCLDMIM